MTTGYWGEIMKVEDLYPSQVYSVLTGELLQI